MNSLRLSYRRADVAALWIVMLTITCAGAGLVAYLLGSDRWWAFALGAGLVLLAPRLVRNNWFGLGVRGWNGGTRVLARFLSGITMRLYFFVVFLVTGRAGSHLRVGTPRPGESLWTDCRKEHGGMVLIDSERAGRGQWLADLVSFARRPGNRWMLLLVPFLFTLMLLGDEEEDTAPPTSTYTLY